MELASAVTARAPSRAAQYVRMSTEHQQYSPREPTRHHSASMQRPTTWRIDSPSPFPSRSWISPPLEPHGRQISSH